MAGYFSNHSAPQSRFFANKDKDGGAKDAAAPAPPPAPTAARPRLPSKHFSTSLADEREKERSASTPAVHPLRNTWVFWFRQQRTPGNKITSYEDGIKKISAFSSVESFWSLWTHLYPPSALLPTTDYLLFHTGVRRPIWEDPVNISGGKWIVRLRKGVADRVWEDLVLAIVGDQFSTLASPSSPASGGAAEESKADGAESWRSGGGGGGGGAKGGSEKGGESRDEEWPEICGCTISVRQNEDILSVWNRVEADLKMRERIRDMIRRVLNLPSTTVMEYKTNNDSMQDKSSFRKPTVDRTPLS
ncbi:translation initiation factor eIF 4e-like domain-containing protein [Amylostereum chailletii]|nr:translation initiation factor eIF 4e-like domain-containing protein [Amylostereum chailletii]